MKQSKKANTQIKPIGESKPNMIYTSTKTHLLYYPSLGEQHNDFMKKRLPKYIGELICKKHSGLRRKLQHVKKVLSLEFNDPLPYQISTSIRSSKIIQILKPLRKHVRNVTKGSDHLKPSELIHCPRLSQLKLCSKESSSWKKLRYLPRIESLILDLTFPINMNYKQYSRGFLYRAIKYSALHGYLKHLKIIFAGKSGVTLELVLRELSILPTFFSSLKTFVVSSLERRIYLKKEICAYITQVFINCNNYYYSSNHYLDPNPVFPSYLQQEKSSLSNFTKVQSLAIPVEISELGCIGSFNQLKWLELTIDIRYIEQMEEFLINFAIPRDIEAVTLAMGRVDLTHVGRTSIKRRKNFSKFIDQWKDKRKLEYLSLYVNDRKYGTEFISDMTISILNHLKTLKTLKIANHHFDWTKESKINGFDVFERHSLRLENICNGIKLVEKTIQNLCIRDFGITHFGFEYIVELFKKKEELNMPFTVKIDGLDVYNGEQLEILLSQLMQIPKSRYLFLNAIVGNIPPEDLKAKLCKFLTSSSKVTGRVDLCLSNLSKKMTTAHEKYLGRTALANKKFQLLKVTTKRGVEILNV